MLDYLIELYKKGELLELRLTNYGYISFIFCGYTIKIMEIDKDTAYLDVHADILTSCIGDLRDLLNKIKELDPRCANSIDIYLRNLHD